MTDTAAAFDNVIPFYGRAVPLGAYGRTIANHVVLGLAVLATVAGLIVAATFASAWILDTALSGNIRIVAMERNDPRHLALAMGNLRLGNLEAAAARIPHSRRPARPTFETRWAQAMSSSSEGKVVRLTQERPWPPVAPPPGKVMPAVPHAPAAIRLAGLSPVVAPAIEPPGSLPPAPRVADVVPLPPPYPAKRDVARVLPGPDSRTAIYDIAAHTVYLPNGERLEAHSGLGNKIDDPQYAHVKNRGPTPPNVYDLSLREQLFHGVRAIRLTPVAGSRMFGRDGMLAHTYMLGANGQSNGCVSFRNYQAFLRAYLRGEIDRLVVVPHLGDVPPRLASAMLSDREQGRRYATNATPATPDVITW